MVYLLVAVCVVGSLQIAFCTHVYKLGYRVTPEPAIKAPDYDCIIFVSSRPLNDTVIPIQIRDALDRAFKVDAGLDTEGGVMELSVAAGRMLYAPTGPIKEYHEVRTFGEVSRKALEKALKDGYKAPLLVLHPDIRFPHAEIVSILGCMDLLYIDLQHREASPEKCPTIQNVGVWSPEYSTTIDIVNNAVYYEDGRTVARDIAGADPGSMSPAQVEKYIRDVFPQGSKVDITVVSDPKELEREYPLFYKVNNAISGSDQNEGRIIFLIYQSGTPAEETVFLVGNGVTSGSGSSGKVPDKAGAAAIAGFMKVLADSCVGGIKVVAALPLIYNSNGGRAVTDEVIRARSGKHVRLTNSGAEAGLILADLVCKMKDIIVKEKSKDPTIISLARETGQTSGSGFNRFIQNAVAADNEDGTHMKLNGDKVGDPIELFTLQKQDFESYKGTSEENVLELKKQNEDSPRHHEPGAFIIMASGLDNHGLNSQQPIKYFHIDISTLAADQSKPPSGSPVLALADRFILRMEDPTPDDWH